MTILAADGTTVLTKTSLLAKTTDVPVTECIVNEDIYEKYNYPPYESHFTNFEGERRLKFKAGQKVKKSEIDDLYVPGSFISVTPPTGPAAGGTPVTIKGTRLAGASGVTFGGTAGTAFSVVNNGEIRVTTPAKAAGAYQIVITDDAGNINSPAGAYTYV